MRFDCGGRGLCKLLFGEGKKVSFLFSNSAIIRRGFAYLDIGVGSYQILGKGITSL
jgi:hypothetical protein